MLTAKQLIDMACAYSNISRAELCKRINVSPQAFLGRINRDKLTTDEWNKIADALGAEIKLSITFKDEKVID